MAIGSHNESIVLMGGEPLSPYSMRFDTKQQIFSTHNISGWTGDAQGLRLYLSGGAAQYFTTINSMLYMVGASNYEYRQTPYLSVYNLQSHIFTEHWTSIPSNSTLIQFCLASTSKYLFVIGGSDYLNFLRNVSAFDLQSSEWNLNLPRLNIARDSHCCVADEDSNKLYAIGGRNTDGPFSSIQALSSIERLDIDKMEEYDTWHIVANLSRATEGPRAVVYHQHVYILSGLYYEQSVGDWWMESSVHVLDTIHDMIWISPDSLPFGVFGVGVVRLENVIYVFGGMRNNRSVAYGGWSYVDDWMYYALPISISTTSSAVNSTVSATRTQSTDWTPLEESINVSKEESTWFIVGMVFICLFGVAVLVICYLAFLLHERATKKTDGKGKYTKTNSEQ